MTPRPRFSPDIASLATRIADFTAQLRALGSSDAPEEDALLSEAFRALHQQAAQVDRAELAKALPSEDRGLFDVLFLGYENRAQRGDPTGFSSLVRLVRQYPEFQRAVALAEYLKTPEGHAFACLSERTQDGKMERFFPDLAAGMARGFLNSIHAENIGRFIGYINAHRMDADIARYDEAHARGQSLDAWLVEKMAEADREFIVIHGKSLEGHRPDPSRNEGRLTQHSAKSNATRGARRPDHYIMEFEGDQLSNIAAIHYGNSTSRRANVAMYQGQSAINNFTALLNATHDHGSPLYRVKVRPYYYLTGLFSVDAPLSHGQGFSKALATTQVELSQRTAIAQLPFLSMIACQNMGEAGTASPHPDRTLALLAHNPFISGCDTLDLHGLALEIQDGISLGLPADRRAELDRRALNLLADKLVLAAEGLSQAMPALYKNTNRIGNSGESAAAMDAFLTTAQVFSRAVPFCSPEDLARLDQVRRATEKLFNAAMTAGHTHLEDRFEAALGKLSGPRPAHAQNALAGAFSPYEDGMPKHSSQAVISPDVQLRECLRQVADGLTQSLPRSRKAAQVAEILRAAHSAKEFSGLFDHRVRWRPWTESLAKELSRKGAPARLVAAFDVLREHGFRGRVKNQTDKEFRASVEEGRRQLLSGLTKQGFGFGSRPRAAKSRATT